MAYRAVYYDTETTGVKFEKDHIIEFAAYDATLDKSYQTLINPKRPIPEESTAIHNITDEMVKDAPTFDQIIPELLEFLDGDVILIAHNNDAFDIHFLKTEFERHNTSFPDWKFVDSLKWARRYRPDLPRHALQFLREAYEIEANQAHRALDDVMVLHRVFSRMTDDLSIEQVYKLLQEATQDKMPFGKYQGKPLKDIPKDYIEWLNKNGVFEKRENSSLKESFQKLGVLSC
ncbi:MAG: DNA polymerase III subunit epsilon [Chlamydiae bacterium CG10_big_fil_rev_8_21_14_0_10_35_9]|nr:MAG: DNA polymerase III subunit epsilon [Chlamydiae bacterium CG10_big_fil_rev_8_21_14_0_10_35_9]